MKEISISLEKLCLNSADSSAEGHKIINIQASNANDLYFFQANPSESYLTTSQERFIRGLGK